MRQCFISRHFIYDKLAFLPLVKSFLFLIKVRHYLHFISKYYLKTDFKRELNMTKNQLLDFWISAKCQGRCIFLRIFSETFHVYKKSYRKRIFGFILGFFPLLSWKLYRHDICCSSCQSLLCCSSLCFESLKSVDFLPRKWVRQLNKCCLYWAVLGSLQNKGENSALIVTKYDWSRLSHSWYGNNHGGNLPGQDRNKTYITCLCCDLHKKGKGHKWSSSAFHQP